MAAKRVFARLALGIYADTGELKKGMKEAQEVTASGSRAMGKSLKEIERETREIGRSTSYASKVVKLEMAAMKRSMKETEDEAKLMRIAFKGSLSDMESGARKIPQSFERINVAAKGVTSSIKSMGLALAASFGIGSAAGAVKIADQYNTLIQRIKTATKETGDFKTVSQQLIEISGRNGAALKDTVQLFQNIARTRSELGITNSEVIKLTNTIQQLGVIGGSSSEDMSMALRQFSQSMAGGVVRAEEFNSIVENMPELAHRIAVGLGITDGELRKVMLNGKLLAKDVIGSLQKQAVDIQKEFNAMPRSVDRAFVNLQDKAGLALAKMDSVLGVTRMTVQAMDELSKSAEKFGNAFANVGEDTLAINNKPVKLKNLWKAAYNQGFGLDDVKDSLSAVGGFIDPRQNSKNVASQLNIKRRMRETQGWADLYGLNDPVFADLEKQLDDWKAGKKPEGPKKYAKAIDTSGSEKAAEKAKKKHEAELKHSEEILANMRSQNEQLRAKLANDDQALTKEKALLQLSKEKTLTDKEKKKYAEEINKLASEHAALVKQQKIGEEKEKLAAILSSLKEKSIELQNQLAGQKELNTLARAEKEIQDAVKIGKAETVEEQNKILAAAKEVAELQEKLQRQKIDKQIREDDQRFAENIQREKEAMDSIGQSLREQNESLKLKLSGQEHLAKSLELERQFQQEITQLKREEAAAIRDVENTEDYTAEDKQKQIEKVKKGYQSLYDEADKRMGQARQDAVVNQQLNKQLEDQQTLIDNIKDSTGSYRQKLAELDKALASGQITQKQWTDTSRELWKNQLKTNDTFGSAVKQIGNNFTQAILNGQKLNNVIKDMGKALAALAAQKLLFEPIANGIDKLAGKMFGTGPYTARPVMPGTPGYNGSGGGLGQLASAGSFPGFGSLMGGAAGAGMGGMFGGGSLLNRTGSMFKNMFNPGDGLNSTPTAVLEEGYKRFYDSKKDALGAPLQDFEYYLNYMSREEASKRLGIAGMNMFRPPGGGYDFFGGIARSLGLPSFALGGTARGGQWALFGEKGPELGVPKEDMHIFTAPETRQILGPSSTAQAWQNNLSWSSGMTTGEWMAKNERNWQLSQERNYLNSSLAPALNQLWRDDTIRKAQSMTAEMMRSGRTDHIGFDILNRVQNGGSMMMAMSPNFQLPTGDQQYSILKSMGASNALLQMAMDNDFLFKGGSSGMYSSGSLGGFLNNPLGYKSMGIEGKTPWKTYQDIDSMDSLAYGGDGSGMVSELVRQANRDANWQANSVGSYLRSMMNSQPLGGYRGASQEYLNNIKGWNKFAKNHKPYADAYGFGAGDGYASGGMSISNAGWVDSRGGGSSNDWIDDEYFSGDPNPQRFDPTNMPDAYKPISGSMKDFLSQSKNSPNMSSGKGARNFPNPLTLGKDALEAFNSWVLSGKGQGLRIGGLNKDLLAAMGSWAYKGKGLMTGGLMGDLRDSFNSWMPKGKPPVPFGRDSFSFDALGGNDVMSFPAYTAMMGMAQAPKLYGVPTVRNVTNSSGGFGGTLSPGWLDNDTTYGPLFNNGFRAPVTTGSSAFDRWPTSPIAAGQIYARMTKRAMGGPLAAGQIAEVGERGKEIIIPTQPSYVVPNHDINKVQPKLQVVINEKFEPATVELKQTDKGLELNVIERVAAATVQRTLGGVARKR